MYNLYIVHSPLQILSAIEAKNHFNLKNNILLIVKNKLPKNNELMSNVLQYSKWDKIVELNYNKNSKFINTVKLIKELKYYSYKYIFTGNVGNTNEAIISNLNKEKKFLIDDGTATLVYHKENSKNKPNNISSTFSIRKLRYKLFLLKHNKVKDLSYFTFFNIKPYNNEDIIKNDFAYLKEKFLNSSKKLHNTVYIIGQSIGNLYISNELYLIYIKQIIQDNSNKKIVYFPHRYEDLHILLNELGSENFSIKESILPIELEILSSNSYPESIVSFFSTALFTLNILLDDTDVSSYVIEYDKVLKNLNTVETCYTEIDSENITLKLLHSPKE